MSAKTSQLQIRITPAQKATLKRMAAGAQMSVSQYVLSTVLPSRAVEFERRAQELQGTGNLSKVLSDFLLYLSELSPSELVEATDGARLDGLSLLLRNAVAAAVEQEAGRKGLAAPAWASGVPPLGEPYFSWRLPSLKPHLMRVTPLAFKRRNVFVAAAQDQRG